MRVSIIWLTFLNLQILCGQSFEKNYQFLLPPSESIIKTQWADINNDSLLDVVVGYMNQNEFKIIALVNSDSTEWSIKNLVSKNGFEPINFIIYDENKDNRLDFIVFGYSHYLNTGNFEFTEIPFASVPEAWTKDLQIADMNNDGKAEGIVVQGMLGIDKEDIRVEYFDVEFSRISSFQVFDFDNNGFRDLITSGVDLESKPTTMLWLLGDSLKILDTIKVAEISGKIAIGDLNNDGYFDAVIAGRDVDGNLTTQVFQNSKTTFIKTLSLVGLDSASLQIADFTSDGLADIALRGKDSLGKYLNWIRTASGDSIPLPTNNLRSQDFGDYDRDGDLDWAQITGDSLKIFNNNLGPENKGPSKPAFAIGLQVYNRMFFYWEKPTDDHTNSNTITYDLKVFNEATTVIAAEFDQDNRHRLLVSHGNMGTANYALQKIQMASAFEIQPIDNAFFTEANVICGGGIGAAGTGSACGVSIDTQKIVACSPEFLLSPPAPQAMWFSFSKGFMGIADNYEFNVAEADTVFSFNPVVNDSCPIIRLYNVQTSLTDTIRISHIRYDCEGRNITLEISPEWSNVTWKNNLNSTVATGQSIVHALATEITFNAFASNDLGCRLEEEFNLKLSKPNLQLNGSQFQIIKGNSVQFNASGAQVYQWTPASSLNNNQIANPIATPQETTEYKLVALDSLGCSVEGTVLVEVSQEAFIPTLFTPNGDERNDNLKIYGLSQASGFRFTIYNREGSKLFETTSVNEATHTGWTGSVNGTHQPPGTYYWKVEGRSPKGELLLNGKKSGVILLVR